MRNGPFSLLCLLAITLAGSATLRAAESTPQSAPSQVAGTDIDAALIPSSEWLPSYEIETSARPKGAHSSSAKPFARASVVFRNVVPTARLSAKARVRLRPMPVYPPGLARAGVAGRVVVAFVIDKEGRVTKPTVLSATDKRFCDSTVEAVRKWQFVPASADGVAVRTVAVLPVTFGFLTDEEARQANEAIRQLLLQKH